MSEVSAVPYNCKSCSCDPECVKPSIPCGCSIYEPPEGQPVADLRDAILTALNTPVGSPPLGELVGSGSKVGVIFDDLTRPTPVAAILPVLVAYLLEAGVSEEHICLVHSPGLHIHEEGSLEAKVGSAFAGWPWVVDHDARHSPMVFRGITSFGTPIWANSIVDELDFMVGLGSVIPHMDAGFSGGHKIVMPGIASKTSVDHNHCLMLSPKSAMGRVDDNPVRQDLEEAGELIGLNFVINTVVDHERRPTAVVAGHPVKAHREGVRRFLETRTTRLPKRVDTVVACTCSPYMNECLKALIRADMALEPGGTLVLCAPRVSGWAPPGAVKRFATFPQDYLNLSTEELAEMVVTNNVDETRHATAAFNYKTVCETHDVVVVANPSHAGHLGALGKCVDDLKQVLDCIPSGKRIAFLLD
ncbi:MAG: lactate racemase domain-containing protein, partial [Firmicutes bacterium]|nr:lactate racemase domain-containing protein [Bacillota bacterium]